MNPLLKKKLSLLVRLADADGEFVNVERSYIEEIALRNGLSQKELSQILDNPEPIVGLGALSYEKSVEYMCDSLSIIAIDHKILPSEVLLCEDIALKLGFTKNGIDSVISKLRAKPELSSAKIEEHVRLLPHQGK